MASRWNIFQMKMRNKLQLGLALIFLIMLGIIFLNLTGVAAIHENLNIVQKVALPQALNSIDIHSAIIEIVQNIEKSSESAIAVSLNKAKKEYDELKLNFTELRKSFADNQNQKVLAQVRLLEKTTSEFFAIGEKLVFFNIQQEWDQIPPVMGKYKKLKDDLFAQVKELRENGKFSLHQAIDQIRDETQSTKTWNLITGAVALVLSILMIFIISRSVMGQIGAIADLMKTARAGDFSSRFENESRRNCWELTGCREKDCPARHAGPDTRCWHVVGTHCSTHPESGCGPDGADCDNCRVYKRITDDEASIIGEAFNTMIHGLVNIFTLVKRASSDVMSASNTLLAQSKEIKDGSEIQSHSVEEVTASIQSMNATIRDVAQDLEEYFESTQESNSSIMEMATSISHVAANAENLSGMVEKTSSLLLEMTDSIRQVADNVTALLARVEKSSSVLSETDRSIKEVETEAIEANKLSQQVTQRIFTQGRDAVKKSKTGMNSIRDVVLRLSDTITRLGEKSAGIDDILKVINGVSDQIKMLALNATILAAQSGEHGKGFSVVAAQIRDLSERTSSSTKEIASVIKTIQKELAQAVVAMDECTNQVEIGVGLIDGVDMTLDQLVTDSENASKASSLIVEATAAQAVGIKQASELETNVAHMFKEIAKATKLQTEKAEKIIESAGVMSDMASQVKRETISQSKGTKLLSESSEKSTQMAHNLMEATKQVAEGSELIVRSISDVGQITKANMEVVGKVDEMVTLLAGQSKLLQEEIDKFRIREQA